MSQAIDGKDAEFFAAILASSTVTNTDWELVLSKSSRCSTLDSARVTFRNLKKKYGMQSGDGGSASANTTPKKAKSSPKKDVNTEKAKIPKQEQTSPKKRKFKEESVDPEQDEQDEEKPVDEQVASYNKDLDLDIDGKPLDA